MVAAWVVLTVMLAAVQVASATSVVAPAFLWAPKNYGFHSDDTKEVVHYQTVSLMGLAKSILEEGGWSNLMVIIPTGEDAQKNVDVAIVFLDSKHSSDISKDTQVDPALADTLKVSFKSLEFSIAYPYVSTSDDEKENSLLFSFAENCNDGFERNRISYTDTYTVTGQDLNKHHGMDSIHDLVTPRMRNNPSGQSDLIVFCSGGFKDLHPAKTEGELLSDLIAMLKKSGAKYTILYASQPSGLLESPSNLPLGRYLAEKNNMESA